MWLFFILFTYLIIIRLEWAKLRYQPEKLKQNVFEKTQIEPFFAQKEFEGKSLQYFQVGPNNGKTVVAFIHGSPGSLGDYKSYLSDAELSKQATMLSIDRLGFGYSAFGHTESSLSVQANAVAEVLKPFDENKIILVGYSLGGPVIAKIAMDFPDLIDGLVLIAPSISPELEPSNWWRKLANLKVIQWFTPSAFRVCNQEIIPLRQELELMMKGWENIKAPTLVIQGEKDRLVPKGNADFAGKMLVSSPSVDIRIVENVNHFILWSETKLIKAAILELIKKVE